MKRREFVRRAVPVLPAMAFGSPLARHGVRDAGPCRTAGFVVSDPANPTTLRDERARAIALAAVDAARSAGAGYADVRLTHTVSRFVDGGVSSPSQQVTLGLSVRALVNGYWGWAATAMLSSDEAVRVARLATQFAGGASKRGKSRMVNMGTVPVVTGEWMTPIKIDPFTLDVGDMHDWLAGLYGSIQDVTAARGAPKSSAWTAPAPLNIGEWAVTTSKQERIFASTEDSLCTQTIFTTAPIFKTTYRDNPALVIPYFNAPVQMGWERVSEFPVVDRFVEAMDRYDATPPLPEKPAQIGRYDMVFSATAMATVLGKTLGSATQIDRALGYEANASGTSYLGPDPFAWLGTPVASPSVTITAERSSPAGLATVKWDDEGVAPEDFPLVKEGVFANYQTTREQSEWLAPWSEKTGQAVRSFGCAMAPTAQEVTMQHTPNLVLHPAPGTADLETLVSELDSGLLIDAVDLDVDWACLDGYGAQVVATEIRHGKRTARLKGVGMLFRSDVFWKNVQALGGVKSVVSLGGFYSEKGEPAQRTDYTITTAPARLKQIAVIDLLRKAS